MAIQAPITPELLHALPKADLHLHLDGSLRLSTLIELARERGIQLPADDEAGMNAKVFKESYADLGEYLAGFAWTGAVLQDPEALERVAYELALDNAAENVRYIEVRFAPQLHQHEGFEVRDVLRAVDRGLARGAAEINARIRPGEPPFRYGIVVCALRMFTEQFSAYYRLLMRALAKAPRRKVFGLASLELARQAVWTRDEDGVPIVGFDLAGQEDGYPAIDHVEAYDFAHAHFLHKTVHAGEAYGAESIFQSINQLHAERIGHGYLLFSPDRIQDPKIPDPEGYVRRMVEYIADRRVTMEVCITSNLQTNPAIGSASTHALRKMLDARMSVVLCTDNRLVSHTTVTREFQLAVDHLGVGHPELRDLVIHGFKRSFYPGSYAEKRAYVRQAIDWYDGVIARAAAKVVGA